MFCRILLLSPKRSFHRFVSVFFSFWLPADSSPIFSFQCIHPPSSEYDRSIHLHFLILICNGITRTYYLMPLYVHRSSETPIITNVCNLFVPIRVGTSHVSHPYSSINLTLPLNTRFLIFINIFFFHNGYNSTTTQSVFLIDLHVG
jgi:hypothetical protein